MLLSHVARYRQAAENGTKGTSATSGTVAHAMPVYGSQPDWELMHFFELDTVSHHPLKLAIAEQLGVRFGPACPGAEFALEVDGIQPYATDVVDAKMSETTKTKGQGSLSTVVNVCQVQAIQPVRLTCSPRVPPYRVIVVSAQILDYHTWMDQGLA